MTCGMSFKLFTPPTNADNRDFGFREPLSDRDFGFREPLSEPRNEPRPFDRSDRFDILTGTPERDVFELEPPGYETQSLNDNFIALGIPTIVDLSEDSEVDLLVYQEAESFDYIPGFTAPPARSYTYIEDFDPIEDEIIVGGKPYRIEIDDEIIAGESSDDIAHFVSMGSPAIDWDAFGFGSPTIDWDDFTASKFFGPYAPAHSTVSLKTAQIMH